MELLKALNDIMPKLGERPVTSLDQKHPTVAIVLPIVERTLRELLQDGWWFNKYEYTAYPNSKGEITLGVDTLSFVPYQPNTAVVRGLKLFNPKNLSFKFDAPVQGQIIQYVQFDELPESAASYVFYSALVAAFVTDLGVTQEFQVWQGKAVGAWSAFLTEHLRQMQFSTKRSQKWRQIRKAMQG